MNTAKTKAKALKKFKTIARVMSQTSEKKISVKINGTDAYTNCTNHINLPAGDFSNPTYISLLEGAIDHETGHIKHSCFKTVEKSFKLGSAIQQFTNLFEDIRMENCVGKEYRGSVKNLKNMVSAMIDMKLFKIPDVSMQPILVVFFYCLYEGRRKYALQDTLTDYSNIAKNVLIEQGHIDLVKALDQEMRALYTAETTQHALDIAIAVVELLKQESSNNSDDSEPQDNDSNDDNSDDSEPQDNDSNDDNSDDSEPQDSDSNDDNSDDSEPQDNDSNDDNSDDGLLEDFEDFDIHEIVRQAMKELANESTEESTQYEEIMPDENLTSIVSSQSVDKKQALRLSQQVYPALERIFKEQVRTNSSWDKRGSNLDCDLLAGVPTGQFNVFKKESIRKGNSAAISLLVDKSSSMSFNNYSHGQTDMDIANLSALSLMYSFEKLKGVSSECIYFDADPYVIKSFGQKLNPCLKNFNVRADWSTKLSRTMQFSLRRLAIQPENKKFMFILTDGDTEHDAKAIRQVKEEAELLGITIFAIGINLEEDDMPGFDTDFELLTDTSLFPKVIKNVISRNV